MDSRLYLRTGFAYGRTQIEDVYFTVPYKIMSPFMKGAHMDVIQMSSSAGLLSGDSLEAEFDFGAYSDVSYYSQSYEKVFDTKDDKAGKRIKIKVGSQANVRYMPYPVIPFVNSRYFADNVIQLEKDCSFMYCDIFTCGRTGMGEYYRMKWYESRTQVYVGNQLDYVDHTLIVPERFRYDTLGMWNTFTHNGMMYIYLPEKEGRKKLISVIRKMAEEKKIVNGITTTEAGIVLRTLGNKGEDLYPFYREVAALKRK